MINNLDVFLNKHDLINGTPILVGFSGGYDSMALLDMLTKLKGKYNLTLCAAHLNHNWRNEAKSDEENCRNFCESNNIQFYCETLDKNTAKTETAAREARYKFFERAAKFFNTDIILTAHTKSDNVETLIYRIAKGTGISGLCGIKEVRKINNLKIFRPLLYTTRTEIENYCIENDLTPNNDKSNFDTKYKRNFVRHEILPQMSQINRNIQEAITSLCENAKANESIVCEYLDNIKKEIKNENKFNTQKFLKLSYSIKQRLIYDFVLEQNLEYDKKKITEIVDFIEDTSLSKSGKTLSLTTNLWLFCSENEFYCISNISEEQTDCVKVDLSTKKFEFNGMTFYAEKTTELPPKFPSETDKYAIVNISKDEELELRFRKNGDIIQPFGMNETIKLKKFFINKNIPQHKKDKIVLLCNKTEVLWAIGTGLSEKLRAKQTPAYILRIEEQKNGNR